MKRIFALVLVVVVPLVATPAFARQDGAVLTGQILDSSTGAPIAGAKVLLARDGQGRTASDATTADGSFALQDVVPATYRVGIERGGEVFVVDTPVELAAGETRDVRLAVQGSASMAPAAASSAAWQGLLYGGGAILLGLALAEWTDEDVASPTDPELLD